MVGLQLRIDAMAGRIDGAGVMFDEDEALVLFDDGGAARADIVGRRGVRSLLIGSIKFCWQIWPRDRIPDISR